MKYRGFQVVTRIEEDIKLPTRNDNRSSGYDFYSPEDVVIQPGEKVKIKTGVKAYMLPNEELLMFIRSSMAIKYDVELVNAVGKIDSSYYNNPDNEGEIIVALRNTGTGVYKISKGDKICQGTFYNYLVTDDDPIMNQERVGGIGSSGK